MTSSTAVQQEEQIIEPKDRTVSDYRSEEELIEALKQAQVEDKDWLLTNYDATTSEANPNDIKAEADRLLVLQSYNILDTKNEVEFDLITNEAKDYFKVRNGCYRGGFHELRLLLETIRLLTCSTSKNITDSDRCRKPCRFRPPVVQVNSGSICRVNSTMPGILLACGKEKSSGRGNGCSRCHKG